MKRNRLAVVVALLVVVALGLATATLANPTTSGGGAGGGLGGGGGPANADDDQGGGTTTGPPDIAKPPDLGLSFAICLPFLLTPEFLALAALAAVALFVVVRRRATTGVAAALLFVLSIPAVLIHAFLTQCGTRSRPIQKIVGGVPTSPQSLPVGGGGGGGDAVSLVTAPPVILLALIAVAAVLVVLFLRGSGDDEDDAVTQRDEDEPDLDGVAAAAGTAADRIEADADVENAVYRAWRDMTSHLDIASPETTTPAEFARAARDAGIDPGHVDTLTDLFREVRYGDEPATEERERRALDALRDIEAAYGGDEE